MHKVRWALRALVGVAVAVVGSCGSPPVPFAVDDPAAGADGQAGRIALLVEPGAGLAPLLNAIATARRSVHMTMYLLTSDEALALLATRKHAGVDVRVVLNERFPSHVAQNRRAFEALRAAGVDVRYASSAFTYTHEKCVVIDGREAWVMTMNLTNTSAEENREYLAVDDREAAVREAEAIFEADFARTSLAPTGPLVVAPGGAEARLAGLIDQAASRLDLEGEELSDPSIVVRLQSAALRGVAVHVVLSDAAPSGAQKQAVGLLEAAGVHLTVRAHPYLHAKALLVDGARAYVGSANFTANSLTQNRELGVLFGGDDVRDDSAPLAKLRATLLADETPDARAGTPR